MKTSNNSDYYFLTKSAFHLQLAAIEEDPVSIRHINNPSLEVQIAAVRKDPRAIYFIKNPCLFAQMICSQ